MQVRNRPPLGDTRGKAVGIGYTQQGQYTTASSVPAIVSALALKRCGNNRWQGNCPVCGYAGAFGLTVCDGKPLWYCHACQDSAAITATLRGSVGLRAAPAIHKRAKPVNPAKQAYVRKLWAVAVPLADTVAARYLAGRGLHGPYPDTLRFLPACWHTHTATHCPAMIAAVTRWPSGDVVAIHRTYLKPDGSGKIEHPQARMMLGDATGGAVRLAPAGERLALAEGIETALSVQQETGIPTWACLSTSGLQNVQVPDTVQEVLICADHDPPGLKAAQAAAERLHRLGKQVRLAAPPQAGTDFNDILKGASHE